MRSPSIAICLVMALGGLACGKTRVRDAAVHAPGPAEPTPAPEESSSQPTPAASTESPRSAHWLEVHAGSPLLPVAGTHLLHDEAGKNWFSVNGDELERMPAWSIDQLLGIPAEKSAEFLTGARVLWAVGDSSGPRYASVEGEEGPCEPSSESLFVERAHEGWRVISEPPHDRSPPMALTNGNLDHGIVYVSFVNSCGHAGPPFDYELHTRGAPNTFPQPERVSVKFMLGRQTFSVVAISTYTLTPTGEVIVLGRHRQVDAAGEIASEGWALEIFRKGAKKTEIVPVDTGDEDLPEDPALLAAAAHRIIRAKVAGDARFDTCTYAYNRWTWDHGEPPDDDIWSQRAEEALLVDGVSFAAQRLFRHAGAHFLVGKADSLDVTFVEHRVHWKK